MTIPSERANSLKYAREFLYALLNPKETPRVPRKVRDQAYRVLRHFPGDFDIERLAKKAPEILAFEKDHRA